MTFHTDQACVQALSDLSDGEADDGVLAFLNRDWW